ncbi:MAG: toxin-antitoxin system HicB family antitoxin [Lachnospiraceae bacterium]|nr:toxin-antitoxin system HicB family antitoxin [Lachnospiraceae bacterium]
MNKNIDYYMELPYRMEIIPDNEEGGFTAKFPDLPGCLTCADTIEDLISNAVDAKKAWLKAAIEDNFLIAEPSSEDESVEYSGQFKLRMPKSLHRSLSLNAKREGISMNQYCNYLLAMNDVKHISQASTH